MDSETKRVPPEAPRQAAEAGIPVWDIEHLVGGGREAFIRHEGQTYRLRITANRKLILTK